jgi:hypothetical protein
MRIKEDNKYNKYYGIRREFGTLPDITSRKGAKFLEQLNSLSFLRASAL